MSLSMKIQGLYSQSYLDLLTKIGNIAYDMELKAYTVGGFVRDLLLQKPNYDIDIMVEGDALPYAVKVGQELNAECKLVERFHTAHIYYKDLTIDFSSARKEYYGRPGELPIVSFSNIKDDLYRRDFTINAMAMSITPDKPFELVDLYKGNLDLAEKRIKILHPRSFIDDPSRLYRAVRFADRFGFYLEANTEYQFDKALCINAPKTLSIKRIAAEIDKCFQEKNPLTLLSKYQTYGLLKYYHKSFIEYSHPTFSFGIVSALTTRMKRNFPQISENAIFWALLLSNIPEAEVKQLQNNSGLPHSVGNQVSEALDTWANIENKLQIAKTNFEIYKILKGTCPEALALIYLKRNSKDIENKICIYIDKLASIKPIITGNDLIEAGIKPGPQIRQILDKIVEKKIEGIELTRKEEIDLARTIQNI